MDRRALLTLVSLSVVAGCLGSPSPQHSRSAPEPMPQPIPQTSLMVSGRIAPDGGVLHPILHVTAPPSTPRDETGSHELRGEDVEGRILFSLTFHGTQVADLPGEPRAGFSFVIPLPRASLDALHRVVLRTEEGDTAERVARYTAGEMEALIQDSVPVTVERLPPPEGVERPELLHPIRFRWDGDRFPRVMVRDPDSGRVVGLDGSGEMLVFHSREELEITLSEGVQSVTFPIRVPR